MLAAGAPAQELGLESELEDSDSEAEPDHESQDGSCSDGAGKCSREHTIPKTVAEVVSRKRLALETVGSVDAYRTEIISSGSNISSGFNISPPKLRVGPKVPRFSQNTAPPVQTGRGGLPDPQDTGARTPQPFPDDAPQSTGRNNANGVRCNVVGPNLSSPFSTDRSFFALQESGPPMSTSSFWTFFACMVLTGKRWT
jgi:hypothetical protein